MKDRLWFFSTARHVSVDEGVGNSFYPAATWTARASIKVGRSVHPAPVRAGRARFASRYQANSKTKLSSYIERIWKHKDPELAVRTYNPITASDIRDPHHALYYVGQVEVHLHAHEQAAPRGRLLDEHRAAQPAIPARDRGDRPAAVHARRGTERHALRPPTATSGVRPWADRPAPIPIERCSRGRLSYVTGSHSMKAGAQWSFGVDGNSQIRTGDSSRTTSMLPARAARRRVGQLRAEHRHGLQHPDALLEYVNATSGLYAQDAWTMKRLTRQPGRPLRHFNAKSQGGCRNAGRFVPRVLPRRHAEPAELEQHLAAHGGRVRPVRQRQDRAQGAASASTCCRGPAAGPSATTRSRPSPTRGTGRDLNGDDIAQDNEIGPSSNSNFGVSTGRTPDPNLSREYNVETAFGVQHQLLPRLSVFGGYFHRHFYNQEAQRIRC